MKPAPIEVRLFAARDSIDAMTALLHRAYAPLAARGMNFTAASQGPELTHRRVAEGQCFVAESAGELVGCVTVCGPFDAEGADWAVGAAWYRDPDTAQLRQFAVDPRCQGQGIGRRLVQACEQWARESGYRWMVLDTAEPAAEMRALYRRLGYAEIGQLQWPGKTYRTVTMRKSLDRSPLGDHLQLMARYNLWATHALCSAVDVLSDEEYRRDLRLPFGSVHGTLNRLLAGEQLLWFRRFSEGGSDLQQLDVEVEPDRAQLRARLTDGALAWLPLLDVWPDQRLHGAIEYQRINGEAMSLPFAATLLHVFNQGTHHRGQIVAALSQFGRHAPDLDLVRMLQEERAQP